ncbi:hypothetical protein AURDEDRAFT_152649 [Auricularia subglabra TFB-10046 SS5]|nr:hypothetical protein AURDEDRAFT_152649 [Auricularia subglabra TFB-10046 SS5]
MNNCVVKRERDGEDELQRLRPTQQPKVAIQADRSDDRRYHINFNVAKWKLLSAKGYTDILNSVEELFWYPVLFDEATRDFNTFLECYVVRNAPEATAAHRRLLRLLDEQCREMSLSQTQERLSIAMQQMRKLRALTIMPSRHNIFRPKPERLNIYAFTTMIAAFGHKREAQQTQAQTRSGRPSRVVRLSASITQLRIADIDLCALLSCVPSQLPAVPLAQDGVGYAYHLPAGLVSWHAMYLAWCSVVCTVMSLQCQFIRSEAFMTRLDQICRENSLLPEAQRWRTTSVLAACQQLQSLSLSFSFSASTSQTIPMRSTEAIGLGNGLPPGPSSSASLPARIVLPELDVGYILPYCDDTLVAGKDVPNFRHLRIFALANVVLSDSAALFNFVQNHPALEELHLENVGYRFGPSWNEILHVVATSLQQLRTLRLIRLMVVDMATNLLQYEDEGLYYVVVNMLPEQGRK